MPRFGLKAERAAIVLGFGLTVFSLFLTQFYLEPAQRALGEVREQLATARAKAKVLSAANAMDNIFGQLGSLVFTLNSREQPDETSAAVVGALQQRALDWRHDGVRTYIAQLGIAGEVDYQLTASTYQKLIEDEQRLRTISAYQKANDFEADLAFKAVQHSGAAAMEAIKLHAKLAASDAMLQDRKLILVIVTLLGSVCILLATLLAMSTAKPCLAIGDDADIPATIRAFDAALLELQQKQAAARQHSPS